MKLKKSEKKKVYRFGVGVVVSRGRKLSAETEGMNPRKPTMRERK